MQHLGWMTGNKAINSYRAHACRREWISVAATGLTRDGCLGDLVVEQQSSPSLGFEERVKQIKLRGGGGECADAVIARMQQRAAAARLHAAAALFELPSCLVAVQHEVLRGGLVEVQPLGHQRQHVLVPRVQLGALRLPQQLGAGLRTAGCMG